MEQFIWFLGRFHVLVLHLPIGILSLAIVFEVLTRWKPFGFLKPVLPWTWFAGGVAGVGTVALGLMHATESGFQDSPAVEAHKLAGISLTLLAFAVWIITTRLSPTTVSVWPKWAKELKADELYAKVQPLWTKGGPIDAFYAKTGWIVACVLTFIMMSVTGHLGGNLTHGETYLGQYAPKPIRRLAGLSSETDPRPAPKDLASADIYLDIVGPALHSRCDGCHNDGKASGGLSIADHAKLLKGGKVGPVITPPDPTKSDLFRRINLPSSSGDFMPKDGKTPLTPEQTAAVGVWIKAGAPKSGLVGTLKLSAADTAILQKALGVAGPSGSDEQQASEAGSGEAPLPNVPEADKAAVAKVIDEGFIVRKVSKGSNLVDVDYTSPKPVTPQIMADLAKLGPNVLRLNLRRAGVTDADVKTILTFRNLRHLRLEKNDITDAAAKDIAGLKELTNLNLTNTKVTDQGFDAVAQLPKLQRLYVWGTTVSPAAVDKAKAARKEVVFYAGLTPKDVPTGGPIIRPDF